MAVHNVSGVSYAKIVTTSGDTDLLYINPFDVSGNLISQITVEIDTSDETGVKFFLPVINTYDPTSDNDNSVSLNGNYECSIRVIRLSSLGGINLYANKSLEFGNESISGNIDYTFTDLKNMSAVVTPVSVGNWGIVISQNTPT